MSNINLSNNLIIDSDDDIIEEAYNIDTPYNIQFNIGSIYINSVYDSDNDIIDEANIDSDDIINNTLESTIYSDNIINNILESTIDTNILPTESTVGIGHFIEIIGSRDQFFNINRNNSYIQQNNISGIIDAENMEDIRVTLDDTEFDSIKIEELQEDYVDAAKAKGLAERVVLKKHARRNALIPTVTVIGLTFGFLLQGTVVAEIIFRWPGLGRWMASAVLRGDQATIMTYVMFTSILFLIVNLVVDIIYANLDRRVVLGE